MITYSLKLTASGLNNIKVVVTDESPYGDDDQPEDLSSDVFHDFGSHVGTVKEKEWIKLKPDESVPGRFVIVYVPGEGKLALADVKVYVRPVTDVAGPGEPEVGYQGVGT